MAVPLKAVTIFVLLLSTTFCQLPVPVHARRLEVRAPTVDMHPPCTGRSTLEASAVLADSTTPGHSPSIGHNSPPN
ncbi:hypothetical protein BRADI_1g34825v3 [Brachypodium distachyon]|uniref:Uncharacterized protein n=1 Tax=Brachypodium distachyon TaxID=15368 RepID=A0A0Q3JIG3_BRADI|nr:hypothetical protein BRADI_1g34825v3 [Brachypodium distachyon]